MSGDRESVPDAIRLAAPKFSSGYTNGALADWLDGLLFDVARFDGEDRAMRSATLTRLREFDRELQRLHELTDTLRDENAEMARLVVERTVMATKVAAYAQVAGEAAAEVIAELGIDDGAALAAVPPAEPTGLSR